MGNAISVAFFVVFEIAWQTFFAEVAVLFEFDAVVHTGLFAVFFAEIESLFADKADVAVGLEGFAVQDICVEAVAIRSEAVAFASEAFVQIRKVNSAEIDVLFLTFAFVQEIIVCADLTLVLVDKETVAVFDVSLETESV